MPDFYDNQQDYIQKLNEMADAFHAGPFDAVPKSGGTMTGPLHLGVPLEVVSGGTGASTPGGARAALELSDLSVSGEIGYQGPAPGDVGRTIEGKLDDIRSIEDSATAQEAIDISGELGQHLYVPAGEFTLDAALRNTYGAPIYGPGAVMVPVEPGAPAKGRYRYVYPENDAHQRVFGEEYLFALHRYFRDQTGTAPTIVLAGDSTIHGDYITDPTYLPDAALLTAMRQRGFDVSIVNRAVSGSVIGQYPLSDEDNATAVCFIFSFGINNTSGINDFVNNFRAQLQRIRSTRTYLQATIVIKTSNAVSDTTHGRDETQAHAQRQALRSIAREYQCLFFDTAGFLADARAPASGLWDDTTNPSTALYPGWMDDPFRTDPAYRDPLSFGNAVHPLYIASAWIWGRIAEALVPPGAQRWATNNLINHRDVSLQVTAEIPAFPLGVQIQRAQAVNGFPIDGTVITVAAPDGTGMQTLFGYGSASQIAVRQYKLSTAEWLPWVFMTPRQGNIALQNTWVIYDIGGAAKCAINGDIVKLSGNIKDGTITPGSVICTLPAGFWPAYVHRFAVVCGPGADQTAYVQVRADGLVLVQSCPSNALLSLDNISFTAAGV